MPRKPHKRHYVNRFQVLAKSKPAPNRLGGGLYLKTQVKPPPVRAANTSPLASARAGLRHKMLSQSGAKDWGLVPDTHVKCREASMRSCRMRTT